MRNITVITITMDNDIELLDTISSILEQEYLNIEFIIKDGSSDDKTNKLVNMYKEQFVNKKILFKYINQCDIGIYDAMNQAIDYATGKWIIFLNSGDCFYNKNVLKDISVHLEHSKQDALFGHTQIIYKKYSFIAVHNIKNIQQGMPVCHQSIFVKKDLLQRKGFDTTYKICADYNLLADLYQEGIRFQSCNLIVSRYKFGGTSSINLLNLNKEKQKIRFENGWSNRLYLSKIQKIYCSLKSMIAKRMVGFAYMSHLLKSMERERMG